MKTESLVAFEEMLVLNGWRRDHGEWVCDQHEKPEEGK